MRIIAGSARGRRLKCPKGRRTRPTPDRVRESLFSILGDRIDRAGVLDLFAGTGAMGLEALSRGASKAVFVEEDPSAVACLRENSMMCGFGDKTSIIQSRVIPFLKKLTPDPGFDLIFADPPYGTPDASLTLLELTKHVKSLQEWCLIVLEHAPGEVPEIQSDYFEITDQRKYGNTAITILQMVLRGED